MRKWDDFWDEFKVLGFDKKHQLFDLGRHGWHLDDQRVWGKNIHCLKMRIKSALIINPRLKKIRTKMGIH